MVGFVEAMRTHEGKRGIYYKWVHLQYVHELRRPGYLENMDCVI
jgi:hypothetical protein